MNLVELIDHHKSTVLDLWFRAIVDQYPDKTSSFLSKEHDPFANPVGHTLRSNIEPLFDAILHGLDEDRIGPHLDNIVRIKAVQEFTPSQAIQFVFVLKDILRSWIPNHLDDDAWCKHLLPLESRIDRLAGLAFDNYMQCKRQIFEIKTHQFKNMSYKILERAGGIDTASDPVDTPCDQGKNTPWKKNGGKAG